MKSDSWINKINPFSGSNLQIKGLKDKLDRVVEELEDSYDYNVKFLDTEPSGFSLNGNSDFSGIEQQLDVAALQRIYCTETWVYNAVTTIAETVGSLPIKLERAKRLPKIVKNEVTGAEEKTEEIVWSDASGEELFEIFAYPNRYTTKTEFFMLIVIDLLTAGEAYINLDAAEGVDLTTIEYDSTDDSPSSPFGRLRSVMAAKKPIDGLYRIPPALIQPVLSEDKRRIEGYAMQTDTGAFAFNAAEIIHIKLPNPMNQFRGLSPLVAAFKPVLLDRFTTEHMIRFYKSGARLGGIITTDKGLNKEQLSRFQRSFEGNYTGRQNHHRTLILPPGMKYEACEQNPAETALLEFCKYNRETILATYKVPPIKMGITDGSSYANAYAQIKIYYNDTIKTKLQFIQDGFNLKSCLMPDNRSFRFMFDLSQVEELKEDGKTTAEGGKAMLEAGLTVNEVRKKVWNLGPIPKGDKSPVVEKMENGGGAFPLMMRGATPGSEKDGINGEAVKPTDTKPTSGTFTDRVNELLGQFVQSGIPMHLALPKAMEQARLEGFTDEQKLGTAENADLIPHGMAGRGPLKPCETCKKDPCECPGKKSPSLSEYMAEALSKLDDSEAVTPEFLAELVSLYHETFGAPAAQTEAKEDTADETPATQVQADATVSVPTADTLTRFGIKKEVADSHWKSFVDKAEPIFRKRLIEVTKFFKKFEQIVMNRFGGNLKSFGLHKARDNDDVNDILASSALQDLIDSYIKEVDDALMDAYKYGYDTTLVKFTFGLPNAKAAEFLKEYAAKSVTSITETTREQLRTVLTDAFKANMAAGDVSKAIREKFAEIEQGRAVTIARTESLTAVSAGRAAKRTEWQEKFPGKKLKKQWVSAQDDRVRDSHVAVDGEVVESEENFSNGLAYPRDPSGPADEVINCRCDEITFAEEDEESIRATMAGEGDDEENQ